MQYIYSSIYQQQRTGKDGITKIKLLEGEPEAHPRFKINQTMAMDIPTKGKLSKSVPAPRHQYWECSEE